MLKFICIVRDVKPFSLWVQRTHSSSLVVNLLFNATPEQSLTLITGSFDIDYNFDKKAGGEGLW